MKKIALGTCAAFALAMSSGAMAHGTAETVKPTFSHILPNAPGKSLVAVEVTYPPGAASRPHRHARSAFIYARVLAGRIESQVDGGPKKVYREGESFFEAPGAHHQVSRNASSTESAKLLAVFVVDTDDAALTIADAGKPAR